MNYLTMIIYHTRSGVNQNEASVYTIKKLYSEQANEQADEQPNNTPNTQADDQTDEYIITKLNLLFNYIYNKGSGTKIGLKRKDHECLVMFYKGLDLYADKRAYELMPADKVLDEKIMLYAIAEIYKSPHRVVLSKLKRDQMCLKYSKTKKYITEKEDYKLVEIINYFIVCLHDILEEMRK